MASNNSRYRLALLASEQILPNLESALALAASGSLDGVHVYWTESPKSAKPAQRIAQLLGKMRGRGPFCHFEIALVPEAGAGTIESVADWMDTLLARHPEANWVLNATGGTKPMSAALIAMAAKPSVHSVLYREIGSGAWQSFSIKDGRLQTAEPPAGFGMGDAAEWMDKIRLTDLIKAQLGEEDASISANGDKARRLDPDTLEKVIRALSPGETRPFYSAWKACNVELPAPHGEGTLFEVLCRSVLEQFGLPEIVHSLEVRWHQDKATNELDLVIKNRGRILVLDLKLREDDAPAFDQIRTAAEATRKLGGLSAGCIMLRPLWMPDAKRTSYARDVHHVDIIDAGGISTLFETIAGKLHWKGGLPPVATALQSFLRERQQHIGAAASRRAVARDVGWPVLIRVDTEMSLSMALRGCNWSVARLNSNEVLLCASKNAAGAQDALPVTGEIRKLVDKSESVSVSTLNSGGHSCELLIRGASNKKLAEMMECWPPRIALDPSDFAKIEMGHRGASPAHHNPGHSKDSGRRNPKSDKAVRHASTAKATGKGGSRATGVARGDQMQAAFARAGKAK